LQAYCLELEHDADRHAEVLAAGAAIAAKHHPVAAGAERHVAIEIDVDSTASQERHTVAGSASPSERGCGMISTDQGMHERRVGLVGVERQLRPEGIGVVVEADASLGRKAGTQIGGDPEVVVEIRSRSEVEAIRIDSTFQTRVLVSTEEFRLRMV